MTISTMKSRTSRSARTMMTTSTTCSAIQMEPAVWVRRKRRTADCEEAVESAEPGPSTEEAIPVSKTSMKTPTWIWTTPSMMTLTTIPSTWLGWLSPIPRIDRDRNQSREDDREDPAFYLIGPKLADLPSGLSKAPFFWNHLDRSFRNGIPRRVRGCCSGPGNADPETRDWLGCEKNTGDWLSSLGGLADAAYSLPNPDDHDCRSTGGGRDGRSTLILLLYDFLDSVSSSSLSISPYLSLFRSSRSSKYCFLCPTSGFAESELVRCLRPVKLGLPP